MYIYEYSICKKIRMSIVGAWVTENEIEIEREQATITVRLRNVRFREISF